jgi:arylformamidase
MSLYDATLPLNGRTPIFPGDPPFRLEPVLRIGSNDPFNLSLISMSTHTGTHVDAPSHYLDREGSVEALPLDALVGLGIIVDMRGRQAIGRQALDDSAIRGHKRVLFRTDSGPLLLEPGFHEPYVSLTEDAAEFLVELGVRLVGVDNLSVEPGSNTNGPVHKTLLRAGVVIVEGLLLGHIPPGPCTIYCLPLKIEGGDGAPARVLVDTA